VAVIIEMVHLATLVHDDIIDEAELRRGKPSLAANWGTEVSVLLGDCLLAHALKLAASFPTPEICREMAAATNTVCAGEILQTRSRGDFEVTRGHYFKVLPIGRVSEQGHADAPGSVAAIWHGLGNGLPVIR
jgi:octaprenyl-diphosphate synthase